MVDYQFVGIIGLIVAIMGQYVILFPLYRDVQTIKTEFSLCPNHRSIEQIGKQLRWKKNDV